MRVDDPTQLSWEHVHLVDYNVVPRQLDPFHYSRWTMTTSRNHGDRVTHALLRGNMPIKPQKLNFRWPHGGEEYRRRAEKE